MSCLTPTCYISSARTGKSFCALAWQRSGSAPARVSSVTALPKAFRDLKVQRSVTPKPCRLASPLRSWSRRLRSFKAGAGACAVVNRQPVRMFLLEVFSPTSRNLPKLSSLQNHFDL